MATTENKENLLPLLGKNAMAVQQKRPALGQRSNIMQNVQPRGKQPLGASNSNEVNKLNLKNNLKNAENSNLDKENLKQIVNPIVPVAQFEAFKVYEDNREEDIEIIKERQKGARNIGLANVHKNTAIEKVCGDELAQFEQLRNDQDARRDLAIKNMSRTPESSPMCVERILDVENDITAEDVIVRGLKMKNPKDIFFEMEEYRDDIYAYLREHELRNRPKPGYMRKQPDVTSSMRTILVDWLVEVAEEYKLHNETLYLAVNYIDRFLSYMSVVRAKLQLVGTAAMFLAAKYEEIMPPAIEEFVYITDDTYNKRQVLRMEHLILKVLGFDLSVPTPLTFITAMCVTNKLSEKTMYLAMYLSELSLLNGDVYLEFLPSLIAASAIAIARHTLGYEAWDQEMTKNTGYDLSHLRLGIEFLQQMYENAPKMAQHAIQDKFKTSKYMNISNIRPRETPILFD